jgi:hypothetical protein
MFRSNEHLRHFLLAKLAAIDGITRMQTAHILEVPKLAFDWERIRHASEETAPTLDGRTPLSGDSLTDGERQPAARRPAR